MSSGTSIGWEGLSFILFQFILKAWNCQKCLGMLNHKDFPWWELRALEKQRHTIIPLPTKFTVGTMQSVRQCAPDIHQTQTCISDIEAWFVTPHDASSDSTAPVPSGGMRYTTPSNACHCNWWCKHTDCMQMLEPWKLIPHRSWSTVSCAELHARGSWNIAVIKSFECWQLLHTMCLLWSDLYRITYSLQNVYKFRLNG